LKNRLAIGILAMMWALGAAAQVWSPPTDVDVLITSMTVGPDSCIPEAVTFNGDFTAEITTMVDGNGQTHVRMTVPHVNVTATADNGDQYRLTFVSKEVDTINESDVDIEVTQIWRVKVIGQGAIADETFFMTVHITNPNPNSNSFGVSVDHMGSRCNGK
jgi:hypothetical protein